ncbi:MAG: AMP-binding protein [Pseudorhodoplanes sp.]
MRLRPWEASYPPGVSWSDPLPTTTVPALFDRAIAAFRRQVAIEFGTHHVRYDEIGEAVDVLASAILRARGPGATCALYLPNTPFHPIAFFSVLRAGGRIVHVSTFDAEREIAHKLDDSGSQILFTTDDPAFLKNALSLKAGGHVGQIVVFPESRWSDAAPKSGPMPDGVVTYETFVSQAAAQSGWPAVNSDDIALIQYTGGTTGSPKGAILTHANLTAAIASYNRWFSTGEALIGKKERVICVLPLCHVYGLSTVFLRHFFEGNVVLLHRRFDVEAVVADIERRKATTLPAVPTIWSSLLRYPGIERCDLSSLEICSAGGAPLPVELVRRVEKLTGRQMRGGWGMTETVAAGTNRPSTRPQRLGSIGIPLPGFDLEVVSLADASATLPAGEVGELRVRGPNVIRGYWNRPAETEAAFVDGWLLTGDIGYMDADGFVFLVGRKKEMLICNGLNVYPQIVEEAIYEHPDVTEALVVGLPDEQRGEAVTAFVQLRPGAAGLHIESLRDFLKDKLGKHEIPTSLQIRNSLPRTAVGKLSRKDLIKQLQGASSVAHP